MAVVLTTTIDQHCLSCLNQTLFESEKRDVRPNELFIPASHMYFGGNLHRVEYGRIKQVFVRHGLRRNRQLVVCFEQNLYCRLAI